ncbi:kinase inhibitor [Flavobacterium akiainvivens]|uniref:Kinase inhibitor n=1 Tax=Flavobacterium akiainvivens TaxID=1202724 RepID=A0A0M8MHW5_9FLAO|nr:YbhB/YbcL family Raf kinase inhibitor-like protein [Flavobacterium akiainvivens]KOS06117.1 kinase inhibitor [Flavobacterium akiainvivens]SFQ55088.1 phospholipid-binding protein, PBP family [Flavobacterium akiainvivens]
MKTISSVKNIFLGTLLLAAVVLQAQTSPKTFTLKSATLGGQLTNDFYYNDWGVKGGNISPDLSWDNAPDGTQAFAITMYDAEAPTGSGWWHWVLFNLPKDTKALKAGAASTHPELLPAGSISSLNDFKQYGYGGPVPIPGSGYHPYVITVYALKSKLNLDKDANPALVGFNLSANVIAKASIIAYVYVP